VGINDHFLDLGGDSLLATQLISKIRFAFDIHLPLSSLLSSPNVAALAVEVHAALDARRPEEERLSAMLDSLQRLSEEEARALLASKLAAEVTYD
jgi:hypothetical protein